MVDSNKYLITFSWQLLNASIITKEEYHKVLKSLSNTDESLIRLKKIMEEDK